MFVYYNPNPKSLHTGDCVIRALTKVFETDWDTIYLDLMLLGYELKDLPSANRVWSTFLLRNGFERFNMPNTCPDCYTVKHFCNDNQSGVFVLATGTHVVAVEDGDYFDSWDSGDETILFVFERRRR